MGKTYRKFNFGTKDKKDQEKKFEKTKNLFSKKKYSKDLRGRRFDNDDSSYADYKNVAVADLELM